MTKDKLRKKILKQRKTLNIEVISNQIINNIRKLDIYKSSKNIMIFYPLKYEINLLELLKDNKNFYLPKIDGDNLLVCPFIETTPLKISKFNTQEPLTPPVNPSEIDLVFVPALCVDKNNYRLGYGKGYYDRFLKNFNGTSIVPISEQFIINEVPREKHDEPIDIIITENY